MSKSRDKKDKKSEAEKNPAPQTVSKDIENAGNYLRTLRLGKGLSIKDVKEVTRISETNINAIEDQDFSSLPADTFTRGLLNIYAKYLGADPKTVIVNFLDQRDKFLLEKKKRTRHKQSSKVLTPKRLAEPTHVSSMTMAALLFLLIVLSFTGYCVYTSWNPFSFLFSDAAEDSQSAMTNALLEENSSSNLALSGAEEIERVPPALKSAQTATEIEKQLAAMKNDIQPANYLVTIRFLKDSRVELIKDGGEPELLEFTAGDTHSLGADSALQLIFSQGESADILVNDNNVTFPEVQDGIYILKIPQDLTETLPDE